ncbi:IS21 family transposase [Robertmurraya andreesenii]|uniref:Integrase catalytic domain-containing protein n=1 Tax=Anoxybacillus andreesenii TaxID=1325932 RepID=A0ABT9VAQ5_9BACL|nr:IS21 family transposase [Robertmurraya andreesenii]MDQ0158033.1 hypothetical protein [Robertmurraya andreesenii]
MSEVNCIKLLRNQKSLSINGISKTLKINWRTAKKYADEDQLPKEKTFHKKGMMYESNWGVIVSDWLAEDQKLKKKSRRTNKKLYSDLKSMGFPGSYRTLCYFVKDWREGKDLVDEETDLTDGEKDKNYERLNHPPAEAQVDFGITEAVKDGKYIDVHCLVMSLPNSNAAFCIPLPGENQECFLHGLKTAFKQLGGVPRKIRIDNLKAAVIQPRGRHEEATYTNEFQQFAGHYGFEIQACNPRSGHEKGNVENKVGYVRYNFVTPAPVVKDLQHLETILKEGLEKDRQRLHYQKQVPIQQLLEKEQPYLLALPEKEYPVFKEEIVKADKYGEITLDKTKIHIPKGYNYGQLHVVKYWDKFKVISPFGEILHEDYRPYMQKNRIIPWISILKSWVQKPRVVTYSRYTPYLPGRIYEYLKIENLSIRKERLMWLIGLLANREMAEINDQFYELINDQPEELKDPELHPYDVDWAKYDQLQSLSPEGSEGQ